MTTPMKSACSGYSSNDLRPEPGFHNAGNVCLINRHFYSGISSNNYMDLVNVTAPKVTSGSYVSLKNCTTESVTSRSFCVCSGSNVSGPLESSSYVSVNDRSRISSIRSSSFVEVKNSSSVEHINSGSYVNVNDSQAHHLNARSFVTLKAGANVENIKSSSYVEVNENSVFGHLESDSYVEVDTSSGTQIKSGSYVNSKLSSVSCIIAEDYKGNRSKHDRLIIEDGIALNNCSVFESAKASEIRASNCEILGELTGKEEVVIDSCPSIQSIETEQLTMKRCNVKGDVTSVQSKVSGSTIQGTLKTANQELEVVESYVKKLVMTKSVGPSSFVMIDGVQVPLKIASIVKAIKQKKISIERRGDEYTVRLQDASTRSSRGSSTSSGGISIGGGNVSIGGGNVSISGGNVTIGGGNISIGGGNFAGLDGLFGNCRGTVRIGRVFNAGGNVVMRNVNISGGNISSGNMSIGSGTGSFNINGINIEGGGFSVTKGHLIKEGLKIPFDKEKFRAAMDFIENWEAHALDSREPSEQTIQKVIISGGHVEEIVFEEGVGQVITINGGTVGSVVNGSSEESTVVEEDNREVREAPIEFECPVSLEVMTNPYKTPFGHTFEYASLLHIADAVSRKVKCPLTRQEFSLDECQKNHELHREITQWLTLYKPKI